ncbi:J domain-containing protein [uncultured Gimesia sp.]|uniref:J domain-containing protein n=1 Tax=uncultured Gimesia sp. TaxID=1678688 RepID=UPI0030D80E77|tara:strand:- start:43353 stop:45023 length:1671 start_codon:yes stop_codon:yes gene_type:complete
MSDPTEPQWHLLPDQPEQFFSLSGEYDVRDLKRSYNALIRKFKPEKFPEEFQRIRAAYERLNDALRYGETPHSETLTSGLQFEWSDLETPKENPTSEQQAFETPVFNDDSESTGAKPTPPVEPLSLRERLKQESLQDLYTELKSKPLKTPYDFYALAVLSDLLLEAEYSFPQWLLEGLKAHPEEPALFELLHQFFVSSRSIDGIEELLEATSRVIRSDRYYYLTEAAWDRLLREKPFAVFMRTLESCEMNLLDHQVDHLLVFYIHILKAALWKAGKTWIKNTFAQIEEHIDRMPFWLEQEYEFLYVIKGYQEQRNEFVSGGPLRAMIDRTIVDYCTLNEQDADRSFLECQHSLVAQREELLEEFDISSGGIEAILGLWDTIADDVFTRIDSEFTRFDQEDLEQRTRQLVDQVFEKGAGAEYRMAVQIPWLSFALIFVISAMIALLCLIFKGESISGSLLIIGCLLILNGIVFIVSDLAADLATAEFYRSWWRFKLMDFYQTAWFPLIQVATELKQINKTRHGKKQIRNLDEIANLVSKDVGLWFYATAQRLLAACH